MTKSNIDKGSKLSSKIIFIVLVFLVGQHDTIAHHVRADRELNTHYKEGSNASAEIAIFYISRSLRLLLV
ncbi:unnamed protein product [Rhizophagus irregularis]|nr:unnamed protein product [Rhizophagus irregularis]